MSSATLYEIEMATANGSGSVAGNGNVWNESYIVSLDDLYDAGSLLTSHNVETIALVAVYVPVFLLAVLGNVFVLIVILVDTRMRKSAPNFFLCNLAIADLLGEWSVFGVWCVCGEWSLLCVHSCEASFGILTSFQPHGVTSGQIMHTVLFHANSIHN